MAQSECAKIFFDSSVGAGSPSPNVETMECKRYIAEADRILNGEIKFFSHEYQQMGFPPNWHHRPCFKNNPELNSENTWSQISDDGEVDIKFIWEANRFAFVYTLVRAYAATNDEKYPSSLLAIDSRLGRTQSTQHWRQLERRTGDRPPSHGMDIRLLRLHPFSIHNASADFPIHTIRRRPSRTHPQEHRLRHLHPQQSHHQRSLRPVDGRSALPRTQRIRKIFFSWQKLLEEEAAKQIFPDGSYAMYSLNYHRFILHLYLYAIQLGSITNFHFTNYSKDL
jgi:hypothetical protein